MRPASPPLIAVVAATLACSGPPLEFGPCRPELVKHVEVFGYFSGGPYLKELLPYSTIVWGGADLSAARAAGTRAVIGVGSVFQISDRERPDATRIEEVWRRLADLLRPDLEALAALYTSDEPYWTAARNGVPFDEVGDRLEEAARMIHATPGFEQVPVATIFARPELDWIASGKARNPVGYAWVGFDQYGVTVHMLDRSARLFLSLLHPGQRVIAVPDAFVESSKDLDGLEERIAFWLAWIERHPQVIAIAPYTYRSGGDGSITWTGARDLPTIRARYEQIGRCVMDANALVSPSVRPHPSPPEASGSDSRR